MRNRKSYLEKFARVNMFDPLVPENWYKCNLDKLWAFKVLFFPPSPPPIAVKIHKRNRAPKELRLLNWSEFFRSVSLRNSRVFLLCFCRILFSILLSIFFSYFTYICKKWIKIKKLGLVRMYRQFLTVAKDVLSCPSVLRKLLYADCILLIHFYIICSCKFN